jgi:hypothetical protein
MRRVLVLALIFAIAPVSWSVILVLYGLPLVEAGVIFVETMAKAQLRTERSQRLWSRTPRLRPAGGRSA